MTRLARAGWPLGVVVGMGVVASLVGCGAAKHPKTVSLRMAGTPTEAIVTIDDQTMGPLGFVARRGVALPAGNHRVTVEFPGYFPLDQIVRAESEPLRLDVKLEPVPE